MQIREAMAGIACLNDGLDGGEADLGGLVVAQLNQHRQDRRLNHKEVYIFFLYHVVQVMGQ